MRSRTTKQTYYATMHLHNLPSTKQAGKARNPYPERTNSKPAPAVLTAEGELCADLIVVLFCGLSVIETELDMAALVIAELDDVVDGVVIVLGECVEEVLIELDDVVG